MDIGSIIALIFLYSASFMAGWGISLILLWIRPEYMFLLFYIAANHVLVFLFNIPQLAWADAPAYAFSHAIAAGIALALGVPIVALLKWIKTRTTGADKQLDKDIERIRAEIAARDAQPPAAQ